MLALLTLALAADPFPALPATEADRDQLGRGVQRTMARLAESTKEKPNRVRILFYGQSITEQDWWKQVVADLKKRFPHADIVAANKAIGGFSSQRLIHTWEADVIPFAPDLVIFHVYGDHILYGKIIEGIRTRSSAEILMQLDHAAKWPKKVAKAEDTGLWWDDQMNAAHLPAIAKKYACGLVDVRGRWVEYLKAHSLEPKQLLKDNIHLNDHGNFVMGSIVSRYLVRRPELTESTAAVATYPMNGSKLTFTGCRIDVNAPLDAIAIDGKPVADFPTCHTTTRGKPGPWSKLFLMKVGHEKPHVAEAWTLTITEVSADKKSWAFAVAGSKTGDDGRGTSTAKFVSPSGRCVIEPAWWFPNGGPTVGDKITWDVHLMATTGIAGPDTLTINGLPPGEHTLEVKAPVKFVTVHRPVLTK